MGFDGLERDGVDWRLTMSVTPTLAAMLSDPLLQSRYLRQLDNLIAVVDVNNQQADGPSKQMMGFEPLADKMRAFGWFVQRIDGNDLDAVVAAFDAAKAHEGAKPRMIIADTLMGKGVPFLEARERNHFIKCLQIAIG